MKSGGSKSEAARRFKGSRTSVYVWLNSQEALTYKLPGPKQPRKIDLEALHVHVQEYPDQTQAKRALHFNVSRYCIRKNLRRLKISRKKTTRYWQSDPEKRKRYRQRGKHFVYVDESGFEPSTVRRFGYACKGQRV